MTAVETPKKEQLDDLLVVQAQVLETLSGDASLKEMLDVFARTIERQSGDMLCSILLLEGDTLRHGAAPSLPEEYSRAIDGATIGPVAGSCGTAAFTRQTVIVSDIATDPLWANYRDLALRHGLRACWSTPILSADDQVIGTFALYYKTARLPNHRERRLMTVWTNIVALGIRRKQAEEALARERDLLQSVLDSAGKAHLVYLDRDFNFVRVNETYAATCGYRPAEMAGKNHFALYPCVEIEAIFRQVRDTGEAVEIHDRPFEFPDQTERGVTYWDWTLVPVKDSGGQVTGLIFSLFETTARVRAEAALRESEERYRMLFDRMSEGFALHEIVTDEQDRPVDYRYLDVNPAFERLTGLNRAVVLGKRVLEVLPALEAHWIDRFGRVALTGEPEHFENYAAELAAGTGCSPTGPRPVSLPWCLRTSPRGSRLRKRSRRRCAKRTSSCMRSTTA